MQQGSVVCITVSEERGGPYAERTHGSWRSSIVREGRLLSEFILRCVNAHSRALRLGLFSAHTFYQDRPAAPLASFELSWRALTQ